MTIKCIVSGPNTESRYKMIIAEKSGQPFVQTPEPLYLFCKQRAEQWN